jgi:dihydroflavonol-4-reductase
MERMQPVRTDPDLPGPDLPGLRKPGRSSLDLVTGATGLVGNNLVRQLIANGRTVRALVRPTANTQSLAGLPIELISGDVTDLPSLQRACQGVENVYHCAALVSIWERMADQMWAINVGGTKNVLQAAQESAVHRLIHCSSVDALGLPEGDQPATEETPWNWDRLGLANGYARSKYEAQKLVLAAAGRNLDAVVVNPTYMFGPYDSRPSSGRMILEIAKLPVIGYSGGGNNFVAVEDVVTGMINAVEHGRCGHCYILGHANLTYREIFACIAACLGRRAPQLPLPYPLARLGGYVGDLTGHLTGREPAINTTSVKMGYVNHYYSPAKAIRELALPQTPIDQAIERAIAWFRQAKMLPS